MLKKGWKKITLALPILTLIPFALVACINRPSNEIEVGWNGFPLIRLNEEARDIVLEDFDYLAKLLLENVPAQVVIERRYDISLAEILAFMRGNIVAMEPVETLHFIIMNEDDPPFLMPTDARELAAKYLSSLLLWLTFDLDGLGHLGPQFLSSQKEMLEIHLAMLHQIDVVDDRLMINDEDMGSVSSLESLQRRADAFAAEATLWFYGLSLDDVDLYREMDNFGFFEEGNVTTKIIEPGRTAYFHINSFMNNRGFDSEILFPFYEEIQDFEHLIIDLRGNGGGTRAYLNYIIPMLIDTTLEASFHEFLMAGDLVNEMLDDEEAVEIDDEDDFVEILPATELVEKHHLPYFNNADLDILYHAITWPLIFEPREDNIPFSGKIWLLVDEFSASLSELFAIIAIDSGFATVVGRPTAGVTPAMHTYISLPLTGILYRMDIGYIIDAQGRSIEEYGVIPDIMIHEYQDALEVVLELIENS